ncbi:MAG: hypothetical protein RLZZ282_15, partial [Verrucomicrobiota bacterium]
MIMISKTPPPSCIDASDEQLAEHKGIFRVCTDPQHASVDVVFDAAVLSESDVRTFLKEHISQVESAIRKCTYRLEGNACEACAQKLESKIGRIPGVRRATATYLGKVLSVTFDSDVEPEDRLAHDLEDSGANIKPLVTHRAENPSLVKKVLSGDLNEEISCGLGLGFLIAALVTEKWVSVSPLANHALYLAAYIFAGQQGVRSAIESLR